MDDLILIIFASFTLLLMLIGFFRKQILLSVFSGIGFVLIGLFIMQGVTYVSDATFTASNWTTTEMVQHTEVWHSTYATPIFIFLTLFGLMLIVISVMEYRSGRKTSPHDRQDDSGDDSE
jgi:TRAP-type C4-dicarboxylate transport system permease small subunit